MLNGLEKRLSRLDQHLAKTEKPSFCICRVPIASMMQFAWMRF